ncbi:MAG: hypothetical protein JKY96_08590, partial [Phycisphaerales bacterium]|nr:hypothetical protein [Phycisphaerales bacterium]
EELEKAMESGQIPEMMKTAMEFMKQQVLLHIEELEANGDDSATEGDTNE